MINPVALLLHAYAITAAVVLSPLWFIAGAALLAFNIAMEFVDA